MSSWSLYEKEAELKPLVFSNNKSQQDVVKEVIKAVDEGHKIIFIRGVCGTGKSAIALNVAKNLGRASVVVPVKALQEQYKEDYTNKKYLIKENGERLKIRSITGRGNYTCPFLQHSKDIVRIESNSDLDIFDEYGRIKRPEKIGDADKSCDNSFLPCKIEIKPKNEQRIRKYLRQNPRVNSSVSVNMGNVKRLSIAPVCPYWSPIIPSEIDLAVLDNAKRKNYLGLKDKNYTIYQRNEGCGYYDQFKAYIDADVIIFNSAKYKLETLMNRKPATEVEIIDECDEFLDSFSNHNKINLNRVSFALGSLFSESDKVDKIVDETNDLTMEILNDNNIQSLIENEEVIPIKETKIFELLRNFLDSDFMNYVECDEENYCYHVDEVSRIFDGFFDETYVSFYMEERDLVVRIVTINLEKRFRKMIEKNKIFVMMSGTIHSENVLRNLYGLGDFKIIDAETETPGTIKKVKTGFEVDCKYSNFQSGRVTRAQYLQALNKCIEKAEKPALVHVHSFADLPTEQEIEKYGLNMISRGELLNDLNNSEEIVKRFKSKKLDILYSTKCTRGVDFPGDMCKSIIMTKYPYPNINSLFWRILRKTKPQYFSSFYIDKSRREFLQRIYRGLRSKDDKINLLSPDIRIFQSSI
ncbi:MAG: helicase C-terminal domain-containing protein [archaeon]